MAAENAEPQEGQPAANNQQGAAGQPGAAVHAKPQAQAKLAPVDPAQAAHIHSKAFENLVSGPDDIVGLLAYAKFKQSVHEAACAGNIMDRPSRNLTPAMVDVLRSAAEQMLGQVVDDGIQAAAPDIEKSALRTEMEAQFTDVTATIRSERAAITDHVDRRTSFLTSFLTNLAAWVVTLILAVVIVYLFNRPSPEQTIINHTKPVSQSVPVPAPAVGQQQPLVRIGAANDPGHRTCGEGG